MSQTPDNNASQKLWTPSNVITIIRILLVPVFVAALLAPWPEWFGSNVSQLNDWKSFIAAGIFVLISCTDWLDGYLARSRNEVTDFGKFMDPLADKILVTAALIALVELGSLPTWVVLIILAREFIVSGVRMMAASQGVVIAASMLGKFKTVFQMIAIVLFTIKDSHMIGDFSVALSDKLWVVSWIVMLIALALTIASMIDYLVKAREVIGLGKAQDDGIEIVEVTTETAAEDAGIAIQDVTALDNAIQNAAKRLIGRARERKTTICTAESLTGGMIGNAITSIAGASDVFKGGVVSYTNEVKHSVLGVDTTLLESEGAVCNDVAEQMAQGARKALCADVAIAVTGIAGPGGEEPGKPVGTVYVGCATSEGARSWRCNFSGSREEIRLQTTLEALRALENSI